MTDRVWVVRAGEGATVDAIVAKLGDDEAALDEGRVFIQRSTDPSEAGRRVRWRRAKRGDAVGEGDEVRLVTRRDVSASVAILHHGGGIVAVDKPAGIPTIPDEHDAEGSLLVRTARAIGIAPGALHPTSRLDRAVSGVVLFAEDARARERLHNARISGRYFRQYVAIAARGPEPAEGTWREPIGRARDPKKRMVRGKDATDAETRYRILGTSRGGALLAIEPVTGRTHQIRVHASDAGAPLLGDRDYGGPRTVVLPSGKVVALGRIALHCAHVKIDDLLDVRAPIPDALRGWWRDLGGDDAVWEG
ncbi:MAG TPA: RluA family pseudouridine synthase [Polyangiaceae bacterium]